MAHKAAKEIHDSSRIQADLDSIEVIIRQACRDAQKLAPAKKPARAKNPNRDYVSE